MSRAQFHLYNIVWLHNDCHSGENYGNHLQRVQRPCELWAEDKEFIVSPVSLNQPDALALALGADLLVIIQIAAVPLEALIRERRMLNRPTVYEINDDLAFAGNWLPADQGIRAALNRQHILNLARACDALQVSSSGLKKRYRSLHPEVFVLDPYVPVPHTAPEKPSGFVIAWAGTSSHIADLQTIIPAINKFLRTHTDSRFVAMGNLGMLEDLLQDLPAEQLQIRAFGNYEELQIFLAGAHIAIAPLKESGFNRGRSDGKFAQYAAAACVALLSKCEVFAEHDKRALCFASNHELEAHLEQLYAQRSQLNDIARPGWEWVIRDRSPQAVREKMRLQFRRWMDSKTPLPKSDRIQVDPRQQCIWAQALQAAKLAQRELCVELCQSLLDMDINFHSARWLLLQQLNGVQAYSKMLALIERAPRDTLFADHYASMGYAIARKIKSEKMPVFLSKIQSPALRAQTLGVGADGSEAYFRQILAEQPYHYFALFGLHKLLQKHNAHHPDIPELLQRMDLLAPEALTTRKNLIAD
ncbi:hypothetical protein ACO0K0_19000 [Undibacterium sp. SXout11W]|uniref:hypothetical protein n=1 Tax=Undibacterium sp. SXout11W TaxID=3413050 RepID=UPI003BF14D5E